MAKFERFEDIEAWQRARRLVSALHPIVTSTAFARYFALRDQLLRASVSIMANIAEGFGRGGDKEFHNFLSLAKASASEVQSHLYVAKDLKLIDADQFQTLYTDTDAIGNLIGGLMRYLRESDLKGSKFAQSSVQRNRRDYTT